ncbi:MAG: hypothetical protein GXO83_04515 [Chlorobi bacterium]|nr:hypothetical protein [Chlorobiota bacterium]
MLKFSVDTLFFDTIFTTLGSTTQSFTVHNPYSSPLKISSIDLAGGNQSFFRLNIDGEPGTHFSDLDLLAGDSLYIFVEVTIDPQNNNNPVYIHDSVTFEINGNRQDIDLVAWGQDVHLLDGEIIATQTWNDDKPYLIVHSMLVDTLQTLTILPGTRVYLHNNSTVYVSGTLEVLGTYDAPVQFSGDRLEQMYEDIPGQWGGIYLLNGSKNNRIEHAVIKNGIYGIHLGNLYSNDPPPDLVISNTVIMHMNFAGISTIGATIRGGNLLIADCGFYNLVLTTGGDYTFYHCTLANYWAWSNRTTPALLLTNYYNIDDTALIVGDLVRADFGNVIIYGNKDQEMERSSDPSAEYNYTFDHCLLKVKDGYDLSDTSRFREVFANYDPGFINPQDYDFHPDSLAFIIDRGSPVFGNAWPLDLDGNSRTGDAAPDLGAFERTDTITLLK